MNVESLVEISTVRVRKPRTIQILGGILAGMFLALAACAASIIGLRVADSGLARLLSGIVFSTGLICIVLTGSQLFTGNTTGINAVLDKKAKTREFILNLLIIFISNFIGSLIVAALVYFSNTLNMFNGDLARYAINVANTKVSLSFSVALTSGILCNILVALAVWLSQNAEGTANKVMAIIFPITAFIICGFEHVVANMYNIPIALFAKLNSNYAPLVEVNIKNLLVGNMLPVTIGNIIGGTFIGATLYYLHKKKVEKKKWII